MLHGPRFAFDTPAALVAASGHVFVLDQAGNRIVELDAATGRRLAVLAAPRYHLRHTLAMVAFHGDLWTANRDGRGTLTEISAASGALVRVVKGSVARLASPVAMAVADGQLWVVNSGADHVSVVNGATGGFVRAVTARHAPLARATSICVTEHRVWVASTSAHPFVDGFLEVDGALVHDYGHPDFRYPTVFCDAHHVRMVDRLQSRVTELHAGGGAILRVVFN